MFPKPQIAWHSPLYFVEIIQPGEFKSTQDVELLQMWSNIVEN